jgi:hypothetical protein
LQPHRLRPTVVARRFKSTAPQPKLKYITGNRVHDEYPGRNQHGRYQAKTDEVPPALALETEGPKNNNNKDSPTVDPGVSRHKKSAYNQRRCNSSPGKHSTGVEICHRSNQDSEDKYDHDWTNIERAPKVDQDRQK